MITVHKAKSIIDQYLTQLNSEVILINESSKRIIYHDLKAPFPSPRFDNSAMDGFAVRSVDTIGASKEDPVSLKVIGISSAGIPSNLTLNPGECIQCMTGATIPNGADAVLMVEHTSGFSDNDSVLIFLETHPGKHI
ncbi:MAG: molybdopterin molybdenumtransferase MoeA, partial [Candidatus Marinimicrobia bacterium]|nr:molybdopterin molybdenumtransferase MoeA [Candidatus Neomarinimicrobiota bacterium]